MNAHIEVMNDMVDAIVMLSKLNRDYCLESQPDYVDELFDIFNEHAAKELSRECDHEEAWAIVAMLYGSETVRHHIGCTIFTPKLLELCDRVVFKNLHYEYAEKFCPLIENALEEL